jgi:hypothetical protein
MGPCCSLCRGEIKIKKYFSSASSRQQSVIIEQLRELQTKSPSKSNANRHKCQKVVPLAISVATHPSSADTRIDDHKKETKQKSNPQTKKETERAKRALKEENNLKAALTHPTILKFLKAFMIAQSADNMLDFYLDVAEIRGLNRSRYFKGFYPVNISLICIVDFKFHDGCYQCCYRSC